MATVIPLWCWACDTQRATGDTKGIITCAWRRSQGRSQCLRRRCRRRCGLGRVVRTPQPAATVTVTAAAAAGRGCGGGNPGGWTCGIAHQQRRARRRPGVLRARRPPLRRLLQLRYAPVPRIELALQADDSFVAFVQALRQRDHDIALLQQQLLVPAHLCLVFFYGHPLPLKFRQPGSALAAQALLLNNGTLELGGILGHLPPPGTKLGGHLLDLLLQLVPLGLLLLERQAPLPQGGHRGQPVLLRAAPPLLQLHQLALVDGAAAPLVQLRSEAPQLCLVPPQQRPLVDVFVDLGPILNCFCAVREFECGERFGECFRGR
mmetsp:Transcript_8779/g.24766  ORF Transcript_8779/g.24766 Transcript_8779/m.24766 type:complete len:320 (-) Transcript_8779:234-1193(-)